MKLINGGPSSRTVLSQQAEHPVTVNVKVQTEEITQAICTKTQYDKIIAELRAENAQLKAENAKLKANQDVLKVEVVNNVEHMLKLEPVTQPRAFDVVGKSKEVITTVKQLMDEFYEWFNEKIFSIIDLAKAAGEDAKDFILEVKETFLKELKKSKFIDFVKNMIKKAKELLKIRSYSSLEMSIAEYMAKEEELLVETTEVTPKAASPKVEEMFNMLTNVMNELSMFKKEVDTRFASQPQQRSQPSQKITNLASSYEAHSVNAQGIEDRVRKLETEFRLIKNKLN
jgi:hypothetical protein